MVDDVATGGTDRLRDTRCQRSSLRRRRHHSRREAAGAVKLLALHAEGDERAAVNARSVRALSPIRNPANSQQKFDVLAITGYVYKAEFRMRFLYAQIPGQCALVEQEILEFTGL